MSKLHVLKKQVTREAGIAAGMVVAAFVLMMGTGYFSDGALESKNQVQSQYMQSESQLGMMRSQISKSADAEKRYVDIRLERDNEDFVNNTDQLKNLLREMKEQYRLSDTMRLTISTEKPSEKPEFQTLNYKVIVREDMEMAAGAISDVHLYSLLKEMNRRMPGIIRIKNFKLTRKSSMSMENLAQLASGNKLELVDSAIKFTWITLEDKNPPKKDVPSASEPSAVNPIGVPQ
jgi:hypothetical protein